MSIAVWIIAIVEIIRAIQNIIQIIQINNANKKGNNIQEKAFNEYVKSLNKSDREWLNDMFKKMAEYPFALDLDEEKR